MPLRRTLLRRLRPAAAAHYLDRHGTRDRPRGSPALELALALKRERPHAWLRLDRLPPAGALRTLPHPGSRQLLHRAI